jgi:hypothetical protein
MGTYGQAQESGAVGTGLAPVRDPTFPTDKNCPFERKWVLLASQKETGDALANMVAPTHATTQEIGNLYSGLMRSRLSLRRSRVHWFKWLRFCGQTSRKNATI